MNTRHLLTLRPGSRRDAHVPSGTSRVLNHYRGSHGVIASSRSLRLCLLAAHLCRRGWSQPTLGSWCKGPRNREVGLLGLAVGLDTGPAAVGLVVWFVVASKKRGARVDLQVPRVGGCSTRAAMLLATWDGGCNTRGGAVWRRADFAKRTRHGLNPW